MIKIYLQKMGNLARKYIGKQRAMHDAIKLENDRNDRLSILQDDNGDFHVTYVCGSKDKKEKFTIHDSQSVTFFSQ